VFNTGWNEYSIIEGERGGEVEGWGGLMDFHGFIYLLV
jgi:hypothetical protein